jgi:branched-chain amino acid transport system substrate-binding protein
VFLLNEDYSFGRASAVGFEKALKRLAPNVEIVGNVFHPRGAANFSPYLQQIQASGADFVLTADWGADLVQLVNQAKSFGLQPRIGGTFLADPEILKGVGDAAIGDVGADVYLPTLDNELSRKFVQAWHAAHENTDLPWPTASAGKAYISTKLAAAAITAAGSTDFDKVEKALEGFKTDSIAGPLEVRACDHQIQLPEVAGVVVSADKKFYDFPYVGPAVIAPLSAIAVPPQETGNPRCKTS